MELVVYLMNLTRACILHLWCSNSLVFIYHLLVVNSVLDMRYMKVNTVEIPSSENSKYNREVTQGDSSCPRKCNMVIFILETRTKMLFLSACYIYWIAEDFYLFYFVLLCIVCPAKEQLSENLMEALTQMTSGE